MTCTILLIGILISSGISAHGATPFPYATYGSYTFRSEVRFANGSISDFDKGSARVKRLNNGGLTVQIRGRVYSSDISFYPNGKFTLSTKSHRTGAITENQKGKWTRREGPAHTKATNRSPRYISKGIYGFSRHGVFSYTLREGRRYFLMRRK